MARKRMLSPEFFTSMTTNALPITAMVTFAGLWCYVDDYGRGEDDVTMVKATVWPRRRGHTEKKVARDLDEIEGVGLICRYVVADVPLLHIPSWYEHQQISHKGKERLPPCRDHDPGLFEMFRRDKGGPLDRYRGSSGKPPETFQDSAVELSADEGSSSGGADRARAALRDTRKSA